MKQSWKDVDENQSLEFQRGTTSLTEDICITLSYIDNNEHNDHGI